jgi:hypothetical protein
VIGDREATILCVHLSWLADIEIKSKSNGSPKYFPDWSEPPENVVMDLVAGALGNKLAKI